MSLAYTKAFCKALYKYWKERVPNAGSIEAWTRGCSCPMLKNALGTSNKLHFDSMCKLHKKI